MPKLQEAWDHQLEALDGHLVPLLAVRGDQGHCPTDETGVSQVARRGRFVGQHPAESGLGERKGPVSQLSA